MWDINANLQVASWLRCVSVNSGKVKEFCNFYHNCNKQQTEAICFHALYFATKTASFDACSCKHFVHGV